MGLKRIKIQGNQSIRLTNKITARNRTSVVDKVLMRLYLIAFQTIKGNFSQKD